MTGGEENNLISSRLFPIVEVCCSLLRVHAMPNVGLLASVMLCCSYGAERTQVEKAIPGAIRQIGMPTDNAKHPASKDIEHKELAVSVSGAPPIKPMPMHGQDPGGPIVYGKLSLLYKGALKQKEERGSLKKREKKALCSCLIRKSQPLAPRCRPREEEGDELNIY